VKLRSKNFNLEQADSLKVPKKKQFLIIRFLLKLRLIGIRLTQISFFKVIVSRSCRKVFEISELS